MELFYALIVVAAIVALFLVLRKKPDAEVPSGTPKATAKPPSDKPAASRSSARPAPTPKAVLAEPGEDSDAESAQPAPAAERHSSPEQAPASEPSDEDVDSTARPSLQHDTDVEGLRHGLAKSRAEGGFFGKLRAIFGGKAQINPEIASELEEVLLASDVGVQTTERMLESIRSGLSRGEFDDETKIWDAMRAEALSILRAGGSAGSFPLVKKPTVVLLVGVNGSGKTTTIGKLATRLTAEGRRCVLAAGDTFRAAAVQQLVIWGERVGVEVVRGKDGADPGSVVFDAIKRAQEVGAEVVLADTAGRLHTKSNLMAELQKVARTVGKAMPGAPHEVLLVLDATNGQNALAQAKEFTETLPLTGLVLTKLDGTAKGGMVLGVCDTLKLPVRFIGLGERAEDLRDFVPEEFVEALLGKEADAS